MKQGPALRGPGKGDSDTVPDQKAQSCYYIGMMRLSKGDKAGAREWLKKMPGRRHDGRQ